jgi:phage tail-like protein
MEAQAPFYSIPQPPHDPTSWLLNAQVGWRLARWRQVEQRAADGTVTLAPRPESLRSLTAPSGGFGGLTPPANMALTPDGSLWLLDQRALQLKRFDPCDCRFTIVPCFGGEGREPRQLQDPHGVAICQGNLFVCDTGNHRLSVIALYGLVLRGHWQPPATAYQAPQPVLAYPWTPYDVAVDGAGRVYVTDPANGSIHRFSPSGRWECCFSGLGAVTYIAIDCHDHLYVKTEGREGSVRILNTEGEILGEAARVDTLQPRFPRLPFVVDAAGVLHLGPLCEEAQACPPPKITKKNDCGLFDLHGNPVKGAAQLAPLSYYLNGEALSEGLDSELTRCQWHRVILRGEMPRGASVTIATYTSEVALTHEQVENLPEDVWETNQTAHEMSKGAWDCLVRSGGGRYLWLRLRLSGNGQATTQLTSIVIEFPRISLRRYLPAVFGQEAQSADFTDRFLSLFDTTLRGIEQTLDHLASYFDPLSAPAERTPNSPVDFLTWLGSWIGLSLDRHWPEAKRRRFLKHAGRLYNLRGTREGLWRQLLLLLDIEPAQCDCADDLPRTRCHAAPLNCAPSTPLTPAWRPPRLILEHYQLRRWLFVGTGRLGEQALLWGQRIVNRSQLDRNAQTEVSQVRTTQDPYRDPFHVYAHKFSVFVPACYQRSDHGRRALESLLRTERPAHTQAQIVYVEPKFRIGVQSMVGFDTVIGRYPSGVTLDHTSLGHGSVLSGPPGADAGPSLRVGARSQVGTTTSLD